MDASKRANIGIYREKQDLRCSSTSRTRRDLPVLTHAQAKQKRDPRPTNTTQGMYIFEVEERDHLALARLEFETIIFRNERYVGDLERTDLDQSNFICGTAT